MVSQDPQGQHTERLLTLLRTVCEKTIYAYVYGLVILYD